MSTVTLPERFMAKTKPKSRPEPEEPHGNRVEFVAPPEWIQELDRCAEELGMSRSAYIRMSCNRQMARDRQKPLAD